MSNVLQRPLAVIGAGTMGSQIAAQCALHGVSVILIDNQRTQLETAMAGNRRHLERRVEKGALTHGEVTATMDRIRTSRDMESVAAAGFVIEAIFEEIEPKRAVFAELVEACGPDAILATNSSTFPISRIAEDLPYPERTCNVHFFHPALVTELVEIMRGPLTSDETVEAEVDLAMRIDRRPVVIEREVPSLIVNRILAAVKREALWLAAEGYATPDAIDLAVKLGLNHPYRPLRIARLQRP